MNVKVRDKVNAFSILFTSYLENGLLWVMLISLSNKPFNDEIYAQRCKASEVRRPLEIKDCQYITHEFKCADDSASSFLLFKLSFKIRRFDV